MYCSGVTHVGDVCAGEEMGSPDKGSPLASGALVRVAYKFES